MTQPKEDQRPANMDRRKFVKFGAASMVVGSALAAALPAQANTGNKPVVGPPKISLDDFPVKVDDAKYKRFHQENTAFCQALGGRFPEGMNAFMNLGVTTDEVGLRRVDKALTTAGWHVDKLIANGASTASPKTIAYDRDVPVKKEPYAFESKAAATAHVKKAAKFLGADLVGIAPYDERWTYASFFDPQQGKSVPPDLPFTPKSVIVLAFEMDYEAFSTAPSGVSGGAVGLGYSQMAITGASLRQFLVELGYRTFAAGNDVALSVPYGVAAGLGEGARNGLLVTSEYGPRVRLAKVFTELEMDFDKPVTFGVRHFCENCMRCADACPGEAIPKYKEPSFEVHNECNNQAVEKWAIDAKKCLITWGKTKTDCSTCITACPYNKPDFWHHRLVDKLNKVAPESLHSLMREMDKLFGYGNSFDKKATLEFWKK